MNLNALKRPFGHLTLEMEPVQRRKNHVICIFKMTLFLQALIIGSPN